MKARFRWRLLLRVSATAPLAIGVVAIAAGSHRGIGVDIVNHCINDIATAGARPLFFLDYFATGRLDPEVFTQIIEGMTKACRDAGCALLGGETAEMPGMYAPGTYDLAGFLVGGVARDKILDPASVREGDILIGLPSNGLHTNGFSLARAICDRAAGRAEMDLRSFLLIPRPELRGGTLGDALLALHRCYLDDVRTLRGAAEGAFGNRSRTPSRA